MSHRTQEPREVLLRKEGGMDVWLPPLALIGCVVVVGPIFVVVLQELPQHWMNDYTLELGVVITLVSGLVLLGAYWGARALVARSTRLLRIDEESVEVYDRKGKKKFAGVSGDQVDVEPYNFVIRAQSGTFVLPVLWVTLRGVGRLEISVDAPGLRWEEGTEECEEEAEYLADPDDWHRLVAEFGLQNRLLQNVE